MAKENCNFCIKQVIREEVMILLSAKMQRLLDKERIRVNDFDDFMGKVQLITDRIMEKLEEELTEYLAYWARDKAISELEEEFDLWGDINDRQNNKEN